MLRSRSCRERTTANLSVGFGAYEEAAKSWLLSSPILPINLRIATFAKELRAVTPAMICCSEPLVTSLIKSGCTGTLQVAKLDIAFRRVLSENHVLAGDVKDGSELKLPYRLGCHVQQIFAMLRAIRREGFQASSGEVDVGRTFQKSGGFRRRATVQQWKIINPLVEAVAIAACDPDTPTPTRTPSRSVEPGNAQTPVASRYPTIFQEYLRQSSPGDTVATPRSSRAEASSCDATVLYDEEGFPHVSEDEGAEHRPSENIIDTPASLLEARMKPVLISSRAHRLQAREVAKSMPKKLQRPRAGKRSVGPRPIGDDWESPFVKCTIGCSLKPTPRAEICGCYQCGDRLKKVHIFTLRPSSWNDNYIDDAKMFRRKIEEGQLTKSQAIIMRDEHR